MTLRRLTAAALLLAGLVALGGAGRIRAKAALAQVLLDRAWQQAAAGAESPRPWPWADSWPIARLIAPQHGVETVVLAGASMRNLAFAPGHFDGTARPGEPGNAVLAGHRDTHFRFLADLQPGDELIVETPARRRHRYVVTRTEVIAADDRSVLAPSETTELTLVTCYPLTGRSEADRRFVVRARRHDARPRT